ncbi:uncharacterized protein [Hoplias malabaricus]|uniref:uncharacterized protein isoform X2 n=1 Tax=Hoplias malabaricus TaxID=27720 RepID=UPI0034632E53
MGIPVLHCLQFLQLLAPQLNYEKNAGENLELDMYIPEPVRIMLTKPGNSSPVQLCSVNGRHPQCLSEYQQRVLLVMNTFFLKELMPSDTGNYTIQEEDGTVVSISQVTVSGSRGVQSLPGIIGRKAGIHPGGDASPSQGEKLSNTLVLPSAETKNPEYTHIFNSAKNDVWQSWIWKNGYQNGFNIAAMWLTQLFFQ